MSNNFNDPKLIKKRIRGIRAKEGLDVKEFASLLGVEIIDIETAEDLNNLIPIKVFHAIVEKLPEHSFSMFETFENENKRKKLSSAFKKKFEKNEPFSPDPSLTIEENAAAFSKYTDRMIEARKKTFGYKLEQIMSVENLTFETAEKQFEISLSTLKKYTGNINEPTIEVVEKICDSYPEYTWFLMHKSMKNAPEGQITPEEKKLRDLSSVEKTG